MNGTQKGFWVHPDKSNGRALLVLHAWWGLNKTIKRFCRRLGDEGYTVFTPDLYDGKIADSIQMAEKLSNTLFLDYNSAFEQVQNAAQTLLNEIAHPGQGIGVIGFSMGVPFALDLSVKISEIVKAVVVFYGSWAMDYRPSKAAYLGHFAELDEFEPAENMNDFEESLKKASKPVQIYTYPGTGHWFMEPDRADAYQQEAAELAWKRTMAFLKETL